MKVAIDNRITYNNDAAMRRFTSEFWQDIIISQPDHDFILITGRKKVPGMPSNVLVHPFKKAIFKWMGEKKFKKLLAEWQPGKLITIQEKGFTVSNFQNKKQVPLSLPEKKQVLFTGSKSNAGNEVQNSSVFLPPALREVITSLTWTETESIKTQFTGGRSFFLFTGNIDEEHQLIELLKAFSLFKKWQQSNMQLVIAGNYTPWTEVLAEKLETYKYRQDVVILKKFSHEEIAKLVAASYAIVYPGAGKAFPFAMLWALQAGKAIIAADSHANRQLTDAALWVEPGKTAENFAKAMIELYKDENKLQQHVQQSKEEGSKFSRTQMLATAWDCINQ